MAAMTVLGAKGVLYRRVGEYSALADFDDALARSARLLGLTLVSPHRVTDAELSLLDAEDHDEFFDVAELRAWESILGNATDTGLRDVALDESPESVRALAKEKIKDLGKHVKDVYGVGLTRIFVGTIGLDFQAGADDETSQDL